MGCGASNNVASNNTSPNLPPKTGNEGHVSDGKPSDGVKACESPPLAYATQPFGYVRDLFGKSSSQLICEAELGGSRCVFIRGAPGSQLFYDASRQQDSVSAGAYAESVQALLGKGGPACATCLLSGEAFVNRKGEVNKAFSKDCLKVYLGWSTQIIEKHAARWAAGDQVDLSKTLDDVAFEISAKCILNTEDPEVVKNLRSSMEGASLFDAIEDPSVSKTVHDAVTKIVDEQMDQEVAMGDEAEDHQSVLDVLLTGSLTVEEATVDLVYYLFKGRDCLARELKGFVHTLCTEAAARKIVEEEVAKIEATTVDAQVAGSMSQTKKVIKEVRRMYPVNPMPWRVLTKDTTVGETVIPAGTKICLAYHETHQDSTQYTNPTKCDPERFSKDRGEDKKNSGWCYVPYGTGVLGKVDRCPTDEFFAQVVKAFAFVLAKKCKWEPIAGQDLTLNADLAFDKPLLISFK